MKHLKSIYHSIKALFLPVVSNSLPNIDANDRIKEQCSYYYLKGVTDGTFRDSKFKWEVEFEKEWTRLNSNDC